MFDVIEWSHNFKQIKYELNLNESHNRGFQFDLQQTTVEYKVYFYLQCTNNMRRIK